MTRRALRQIVLWLTLSLSLHSITLQADIFSAIASPKGVGIAICLYGLNSGIANLLCGFDWEKYTRVSPPRIEMLRRTGWLCNSVGGFMLAAFVPIVLREFHIQHPILTLLSET